MNAATRFTIVAGCLLLCAGAIIVANPSRDKLANVDSQIQVLAGSDWTGYRFAAGDPQKFDLRQLETAILLHDAIKSGCNRIEFGSIKMEGETALVEVFYFARDERMLPFLYKLVSEKDSWKIVSVERMWSMPRSHLIRALRV